VRLAQGPGSGGTRSAEPARGSMKASLTGIDNRTSPREDRFENVYQNDIGKRQAFSETAARFISEQNLLRYSDLQ